MDQEQRNQIISAALQAAISGLSETDISENTVRGALRLDPNTNLLHVVKRETVVQVNTVFGNAIYIKESGPSWVQYHDHRPHDEWGWLIDPAVITPPETPAVITPPETKETT